MSGIFRGRAGWAARLMLVTLALLAASALAAPVPGRADTRYPVLLVHGGGGRPSDFAMMQRWLADDGYTSFTVDLDPPATDVKKGAETIAARVTDIQRLTNPAHPSTVKIHLVGHSMGGLSARYYLKVLGGLGNVATYTALGSPQHGSVLGCVTVPDQCPGNQVLRDLNHGDDTPGSVYYTSIGSTDEPVESNGTLTRLDGGACLPLVKGGLHAFEPRDPVIYRAVLDGLISQCPPGRFTTLKDLPD
ncbi:MAG TPA: alpha/beta fold hydrolase [Pseudonocardiaceae bacterium]|nr:alpha/beta fold hydrolase [Pseudonocardiaceae bacterium]